MEGFLQSSNSSDSNLGVSGEPSSDNSLGGSPLSQDNPNKGGVTSSESSRNTINSDRWSFDRDRSLTVEEVSSINGNDMGSTVGNLISNLSSLVSRQGSRLGSVDRDSSIGSRCAVTLGTVNIDNSGSVSTMS